MSIKIGTVTKRCPDGEVYKFKNGKAEVPGVRFSKRPVYITLSEFNELVKETMH